MRQPDGVTRQRLAANEHLREVATLTNERPGEVLNLTSANADVAQRDATAQQASDLKGRLAQVGRAHHPIASQLNVAAQAPASTEPNSTAGATTSAQHFAQQQAELAAVKTEVATLRESLDRQLANAYVRAADAEAAAERLARREAELAEAVEAHQKLQRRFSAVVVLLQEQDADLEAKTEQLTKREAEFAAATEKRLSVERQLAEVARTLDEAVRRSASDRSTAREQAAQRQSKFDLLLREEVAKSETLAGDLIATRQQLAHAHTMFKEADARHALAMTTAAAQFNEQESRHEARIAEALAARDAVSRQLQEATAALDTARREHLANATTATERFAQHEATLREATAARELLEGQLAAAHIARQAAEERVAA